MDHSQHALVSLVSARRGDTTLASLLGGAANRMTADARDQATALKDEAGRLRRNAWQRLQSARGEFEASRQRAVAIRNLGVDCEVKAAATRAAAQDLARARQSLRKAAECVEEAVHAARSAESQAERVIQRASVCPEVVAYAALRDSLGSPNMCKGPMDRAIAGLRNPAARAGQTAAPHPTRRHLRTPEPVCADGRDAA
jgi:hypothetical protein